MARWGVHNVVGGNVGAADGRDVESREGVLMSEPKFTSGPWYAWNVIGAGWQIGTQVAFEKKMNGNVGHTAWFQFPTKNMDEEEEANANLMAAAQEMYEALEAVADAEEELCTNCMGNGRMWADGKAHLPSYRGPTVACPVCGGIGTRPIDFEGLKEMCRVALAKAKRRSTT